MIDQIENLPEVSFIDDITLKNIEANLIENYKDRYEQLTGKRPDLARADVPALILYACSVQLYQILLYADRTGKMNLLKYAYDEYLDNIAATKGITRLPARAAVCMVRFTASDIRESIIGIPEGTRVKAGKIFFATDEYMEIAPGEEYVDVPCTCQTTGEDGNGILAGEIDTLVDPIPYIDSIANIDDTTGGADIEDDDDLIERIFLAPSGYSTAGPGNAYKYFVHEFSTEIGSVIVSSPEPCEVVITILMENGDLPSQSFMESLEEYLSSDDKRPLTDHVTVKAPDTVNFDIDFTYWINKSESSQAVSLQAEVAQAVQDYIEWQTEEIGRDINPSELQSFIMDAGAKRVEIRQPVFTPVGGTRVARVGTVGTVYGGIEDD